ncbi:MAG: hypothetical protein GY711_12615 [bacterium]|nr:hypothetical protein [bacterium]
MPAGQLGYFLVGRTEGFAMPFGSEGFLCLMGNIGRLRGVEQVVQGPAESALVDLTAPPVHPPEAVMSGDTWNFQCWYRDGTTSSFSDGLRVLFD